MFKYFKRAAFALLLCVVCVFTVSFEADAADKLSKNTGIKYDISASGEYSNWDGVSTAAQFKDEKGRFCFAYKKGKKVIVVKTSGGKVKEKVSLAFKGSLFGSCICDSEGNYYVVSGKKNSTSDTSINTIFISKYDSSGNYISKIGDNGSSSLEYYYDESFYTMIPFSGGGIDVAINQNILAVNYAREMYSGHQSNSVFAINTDTMTEINYAGIYSSHSFGQRAVSFGDGFLFMSEGDCYNRAFTLTKTNAAAVESEYDIFHFWVKKGTLDKWDMYTLNDNFAHIGDLVNIDDEKAAFVATSAKSLNSSAASQTEQVFIQIFDMAKDLGTSSGYITSGKRSGLSGGNGDESVTDYGAKFLTSGSTYTYYHPQAAYDGNGNIIVLFEQYKGYTYKGVYYMVLDTDGNVTTKKTLFSKTATLNPCETPVVSNGMVCWCANKYGDSASKIYIYRLRL